MVSEIQTPPPQEKKKINLQAGFQQSHSNSRNNESHPAKVRVHTATLMSVRGGGRHIEAQRGPDLDSADLFFCFLERPSGTRSINDRIPAESEPHVTNAHNATVQPQHITQKWDRHASIDTQKRKKRSSDDSSAGQSPRINNLS